jgi:hypothetical protein
MGGNRSCYLHKYLRIEKNQTGVTIRLEIGGSDLSFMKETPPNLLNLL